jgi:hypothetical protein
MPWHNRVHLMDSYSIREGDKIHHSPHAALGKTISLHCCVESNLSPSSQRVANAASGLPRLDIASVLKPLRPRTSRPASHSFGLVPTPLIKTCQLLLDRSSDPKQQRLFQALARTNWHISTNFSPPIRPGRHLHRVNHVSRGEQELFHKCVGMVRIYLRPSVSVGPLVADGDA